MHSIAHFSNHTKPSMLKMGLHPITDSEWIEPFSVQVLEQFVQHKRDQLEKGKGAVLVHECANAAVAELQRCLFDYLNLAPLDYPVLADGRRMLSSELNASEDVLKNMSLWLPDDICILQPQSVLGQRGEDYVLTAASVLSPSHWKPQEKFLKPLAAIHQPIPGFDTELTPKVTRFFNHLKQGKPVVRYNWGLQPGASLNWQADNEPAHIEESDVHYRSERQTLLRLPGSSAVVFFIRINLCPLDLLCERYNDPAALDKLKAFVTKMPSAQKTYKGIHRFPWLLKDSGDQT